jgi:hypothetical protein
MIAATQNADASTGPRFAKAALKGEGAGTIVALISDFFAATTSTRDFSDFFSEWVPL